MDNKRPISLYSIVSYPRSGSHYLQNLLKSRLGIDANRYHNYDLIENKNGKTITVIRNPLDSIASSIALYANSGLRSPFAEELANNFVNDMNGIYEVADAIVSFDELISDPDTVARKLSVALQLPVFDSTCDISVQPESDNAIFMVTSTAYHGYEKVRDDVSKIDLSLATQAYQKALSKSI